METKDCASLCCDDSDCPCTKVCDETHCGKHFAEEAAYWAGQFGLKTGMTKEGRRAQLEKHRPESAKRGCGVVFCPYCGQDADPDTRIHCGEPHGVECGKESPCGECEDLVSSTTWRGLPYTPPEGWTKEDCRESAMENGFEMEDQS